MSDFQLAACSPPRHLSDKFWDASMSVAAGVLLAALVYAIGDVHMATVPLASEPIQISTISPI